MKREGIISIINIIDGQMRMVVIMIKMGNQLDGLFYIPVIIIMNISMIKMVYMYQLILRMKGILLMTMIMKKIKINQKKMISK